MHQPLPTEASGNGFVALLLLLGVAGWCWLGRGPLCLRWPALAALLVVLPGTRSFMSSLAGAFAGPMLLLLILIFAMNMMVRGRVGSRRSRYYDELRRKERWYGR